MGYEYHIYVINDGSVDDTAAIAQKAGASRVINHKINQGLGAAMFLTTGMAILSLVFPPAKRGKAIGMLVTAVYVGLATGPFVGGFLTRYLGWRSIFAPR